MPLIALIDDRRTNRAIFGRLAASVGPDTEVLSFAEPETALVTLRERIPDLVISDYNMPGMNGAEFTRHFRTLPHCAEVPVIVITAHGKRDWKMGALEAGAMDFLSSPVDPAEFLTRVRNLLQFRRHQVLLEKRADQLESVLASTRVSHSQALRDSSRRLTQVIDSLPIMISATDRQGRILFSNAFRDSFFGRKGGASRRGERNLSAGDITEASAFDRTVLATGTPLPPFEEELQNSSGNSRIFVTQKSPLRDGLGRVTGVLSSGFDITERKTTKEHLPHLAQHDLCTDPPNQVRLMQRLTQMMTRVRREDRNFALRVIRLQGFSEMNHLLGHQIDDHFMKAATEHLSVTMREADFFAQIDNDTLAILQARVSCPDDAKKMARRIQGIVNTCGTLVDNEVSTSASIGIALCPNDGGNAGNMLKRAEAAMGKALATQSICFAEMPSARGQEPAPHAVAAE